MARLATNEWSIPKINWGSRGMSIIQFIRVTMERVPVKIVTHYTAPAAVLVGMSMYLHARRKRQQRTAELASHVMFWGGVGSVFVPFVATALMYIVALGSGIPFRDVWFDIFKRYNAGHGNSFVAPGGPPIAAMLPPSRFDVPTPPPVGTVINNPLFAGK